ATHGVRIARALATRTVMLREQAHHEPGRTVSALRSAGGGHSCLGIGQFAIASQSLHRIDLLSREHGDEEQAAIHRAISRARRGIAHYEHRARAALTFRAAFFRAGKSAVP